MKRMTMQHLTCGLAAAVAMLAATSAQAQFNPFNFGTSVPSGFNAQNVSNSFAVSGASNEVLTVSNNTWLKVELGSYNVNASTILEFDVTATGNAEVIAVGFERDLVESSADTIRIGGSESFGQAYHIPVVAGGTRSIKINVGQYITSRAYNRITFIRDHDVAPSGSVSFSNVRLYQGTPDATPNINFNAYTPVGFPGENVSNLIAQGGNQGPKQSLSLRNNSWAYVDLTNYNLTDNTVLSFDFMTTGATPEVLGVGFFNALSSNSSRTVQIGGTQAFGVPFGTAPVADTFTSYQIPVGLLLNDPSFRYLTFIRDADTAANGTAFYTNIRLTEAPTTPVLPPKPSTDVLNFNNFSVLSHFGNIQTQPANNNDLEPAAFSTTPFTINFTGNSWKVIKLDYQVTNNSVIEFDFRSTGTTPEIAAIALQNKSFSPAINDNKPAVDNQTIQVFGTQNFGKVTVPAYSGAGAWQHYALPLSSASTLGRNEYLFLINDADLVTGTNVSWRNLRIFEQGSVALNALDLETLVGPLSMPTQDIATGDFSFLETGYAFGIFGNTWKAFEVNKPITASTVLHFEFESDGAQPEISAITLNRTTLNANPATSVQFFGTQSWATFTAPTYTGNGAPQSYSIPVGTYLPAGTYRYLTFGNDADVTANTNVKFRNIRWTN